LVRKGRLMMREWYKPSQPICTYNPHLRINPENVELSGNLSPLTNFFLNVFVNAIEKRNLIIAIPDVVLRPIPIVSYLYANLKNKSVIIFGGENTCDFHYKNYHLLNPGEHFGGYLSYSVPLGFISEEGIEAKVYLPRARREFRQGYIQHLRENFLESHKPKILVSKGDRRIDNIIERLVTDEGTFDNPIRIDIGVIIFENIDMFVYSQYSTELFLKWLSPLLDREVRFIFHFANPDSKFIKTIKEATNSLVVPFGTAVLRSNTELQRKSIEYFKEIYEHDRRRAELINKYNIDRQYFYENITSVEIEPVLKAGNIDYHLHKAREVLSRIDENKIKNKKLYYTAKSLLYKLPNLVINPSKYKVPYGDDFVRWGHYTISQLLGMLRERIPDENKDNFVFLDDMIAEIYCIYSELKECRRYGEEKTYSRVAKEYKVLEIIDNAYNEKNSNKMVIATCSPFERNILEGDINDLHLENGFEIETIHQINRSTFDYSKATLVLPGWVYMKYLPILLKPYKKVIIMAYEGENHKIIKEQIDLFYTYSIEQEETLMAYLEEVYNFLGIQIDALFKDYFRRRKQSVDEKVQTQPEGEDRDAELLDRLREIVETEPRYKRYKEYEDEIAEVEGKITELDKEEKEIERRKTGTFYEIFLRKMGETQRIRKLLPAEKTYIYEENGEIQEGSPRNLKSGFHIVILDNDERKTLLDLIIEVFDLEQSVDKHLVGLWKERLMKFVEENDLSYASFHRLYEESGGKREYQTVLNWAKGNVIAPGKTNDLFIIGKILEDAEIIEDYQVIDREVSKLRNRHRNIGRKLRKIIKEMLRGGVDTTKLSYE